MSFQWSHVLPRIFSTLFLLGLVNTANAQLTLNEANTVSSDDFVSIGEIYEGFDYGAMPYSGNDNPVNDPVPGNPFPPDIDSGTPGNQTTLPNGWDLASPTGWSRIEGNGGDWIELVVTEDHTDLRGYTLFWENDDHNASGVEPGDGIIGNHPEDRGYIKFLDNKAFADLRAGTIITLSEDDMAIERRDTHPVQAPGIIRFDTGHVYDLSTDESFDPFSGEDWHVHFHVDESLTDIGIDTDYFAGFSDIKVDNEDWQMMILDATNTSVVAEAEDPGVTFVGGLTVGLVQDRIGEDTPTFGDNVPGGAGGVNSEELIASRADPSNSVTAADFEDVDFSTFGAPNLYNLNSEDTLDGAQDFSALRNPVRDNTYDYGTGGTFGAATWVNARTGNNAATAPQANWTARLNNSSGGNTTVQVTTSQAVSHVNVMADSGTMTLEVTNSGSLNVGTGRVLVMDGGRLNVAGMVVAQTAETFAGGIISGGGLITGDLANSGGSIDPTGALTISGDFRQDENGTLDIEINGAGAGQFGALVVGGAATIEGAINVALGGGFTPDVGNAFVIVDSSTLALNATVNGPAMMSSFLLGGNKLAVSFTAVSPDFDMDGDLDLTDVDNLVQEIVNGTNIGQFDLTGDGFVDGSDLDAWLLAGGNLNNASRGAYLRGDANLNGAVDGADFIIWNDNKFQMVAAWSGADFNASGAVDGGDFILWNDNKFQSSDVVSVPEPATGALLALALVLGLVTRRGNRD